METVIISDDDDDANLNNEFNYEENKEKYYLNIQLNPTPSADTFFICGDGVQSHAYYPKIKSTIEKTSPIEEDPVHPQSVEDIAKIVNIIKFGSDMNKYRTKYIDIMDVIQEDNKDLLIAKRINPEDPILEVVPLSSSYDAIAEVFLAFNDLDGEEFYSKLLKKYYMPRLWIEKFLDVCHVRPKRKTFIDNTKKIEVNNGETTPHVKYTVEWTITKMLDESKFQYVLWYIDLYSYYVILKPLKTLTTEEFTLELLKIFADFGIPKYYTYDRDNIWLKEIDIVFVAMTITSMLNTEFPKRMPNIQGNKMNNAKFNIQNMLGKISHNKDWPITIKNVQWIYNTTKVKGLLSNSPYYIHFEYLSNYFKDSNEIKMIWCSVCKKQIYKMYKCYICNKSVHIICCIKTLDYKSEPKKMVYKCKSCNILEILQEKRPRKLAKV